MGYYIEGPAKGKAPCIKSEYDGEFISCPSSFDEVPEDKALICVVDNGFFEAAGYCFSQGEFDAFTFSDPRPKQWMLMDKLKAQELSGFPPERA